MRWRPIRLAAGSRRAARHRGPRHDARLAALPAPSALWVQELREALGPGCRQTSGTRRAQTPRLAPPNRSPHQLLPAAPGVPVPRSQAAVLPVGQPCPGPDRPNHRWGLPGIRGQDVRDASLVGVTMLWTCDGRGPGSARGEGQGQPEPETLTSPVVPVAPLCPSRSPPIPPIPPVPRGSTTLSAQNGALPSWR